jgi:hypothetical protein
MSTSNANNSVESFLSRGVARDETTVSYLDELLELYERTVAAGDEQLAIELREAFLLALDDRPETIDNARFARFLAEHVTPGDFAKLKWEAPERVIKFCEILYSFQFETDKMAEQVRRHVSSLLREALQQFERKRDYEQMLHLLQTAPTSPTQIRGELLRLRNRVHLYEMNRVRRNRRMLYGYLMVQAVFVLVIFPLLFVYAENGALRDKLEEATNVDLPEKTRQYLAYSDGLYWSVITAASIGYGDVTPRTEEGRVIAAILGTMGVITIGVIAGLILNWITPRRFD